MDGDEALDVSTPPPAVEQLLPDGEMIEELEDEDSCNKFDGL